MSQQTPTTDSDPILLAAEECFAQFGIAKTTMEDVARAANLSRATVYRRYSDRESLIMACVLRRSRLNIGPARSYIANCPTLEQKIVEGMCHNINRGRRDPLVRRLVSPEEMMLSTTLLWRSGAAVEMTYELWAPILTEAQMLGEMRKDVDIRLLCEWIAELELTHIGQDDDSPEVLDRFRRKIRQFLVPSLEPR